MACWRRSVSRHARLTPEACATGALPSEQGFLLFGPRAPTALASRYWAGCRMLNDRDNTCRHEASDAHRVSRTSELRHLDHAASSGHFDAPACPCRQDLESPRAPGPSVNDHLHHVSDHPTTLAIGCLVDRRRLPRPSGAGPHRDVTSALNPSRSLAGEQESIHCLANWASLGPTHTNE